MGNIIIRNSNKVCYFLSNGDVWCVIWISHDLSFRKTPVSVGLLPTGEGRLPPTHRWLKPSRPFPAICQELIACQKSKALEMASGRSKAGDNRNGR